MVSLLLVGSGPVFYELIIKTPPASWANALLTGGQVLLPQAFFVAILFTRSAERTKYLCFLTFIVMHWLAPYSYELKRHYNKEVIGGYPLIWDLAWNHLLSLINPWGKMGPFAPWKVYGCSLATFTAVVVGLAWAEDSADSPSGDAGTPPRGVLLVYTSALTLLCGVATAAGYIHKSRSRPVVAPFSVVTPAQLPPTIPGPVPDPQIADDTSLISYHSYLERAALGAPGISMGQEESAEWSAFLQTAADMVEAQPSEQRRRSALRAWHLRIEALASSMMVARLNTVMRQHLRAIRSYMALQRWQMARRADVVDAWVSMRSLEEWLKMRARTGLPDYVHLLVAQFLLAPPSFLRKLKKDAEKRWLCQDTLRQMIGMESAEGADADADPKASWADQLAGDIPKLVTSIVEELEAVFGGLPEARS